MLYILLLLLPNARIHPARELLGILTATDRCPESSCLARIKGFELPLTIAPILLAQGAMIAAGPEVLPSGPFPLCARDGAQRHDRRYQVRPSGEEGSIIASSCLFPG
jgi:hypothetical protein